MAIGVVLALLYLFPIVLAFIGNEHWQHRLERWTPTIAGLTIQDTTGLREPGDHAVGRAGRAGDLGRRRAAGRRPGVPAARRLTGWVNWFRHPAGTGFVILLIMRVAHAVPA